MKYIGRIKAIVLATSIMLGGGIAYYYYHQKHDVAHVQNIIEFDYNRDAQDIKQLFKDNWYWLISGDDYDVDFMLKTHSPGKDDSQYFGKLQIKVMRDNEGFKGFVAYYKKSFYLGQLLFIAVKKDFRGRGYGKVLAQFVLDEFKKMGVLRTRLVTRVENLPAQAVYKKLGFKEVENDGTFVYFEKWLG